MGVSKPVFTCKYQKFSLTVLLSICWIFCKFQPGVAHKSVAYKKKRALMFSSKVWFNSYLCKTFEYFSFPDTIKPGK